MLNVLSTNTLYDKSLSIRLIFLCIAAVILFSAGAVFAGPDLFVPFVSLKQEYNDNILFGAANEEDDWITTGTAGFKILHKSERVNTKLDARLMRLVYADNDQLDDTNGRADFDWKYQYTEKLEFNAGVDFKDDSRRDRDTDTTGLVLPGDRTRTGLDAGAGYLFSEVLKGGFNVSYSHEDVDETQDDETNESFGLELDFSKNLSKTFKNTTGLLNIRYQRYSSDVEQVDIAALTTTNYYDYTSDIFQVYAGFSKDITELYSFYLQAGISYSSTAEGQRTRVMNGAILVSDVTVPDQDDSTTGGVLLAGVNYDGLYHDIDLSISHDMRGSAGSNGSVERSAVSLGIDKKVSEDFFLTFGASCYLNRNDRTTQSDLDKLTVNIQPGFRYKFWDSFTLTGTYRFTSVDDRENNTDSDRNLFYVMVKKEFELK